MLEKQVGCRRRVHGDVERVEGNRAQAHRAVIKNPVLQQENHLPFISQVRERIGV